MLEEHLGHAFLKTAGQDQNMFSYMFSIQKLRHDGLMSQCFFDEKRHTNLGEPMFCWLSLNPWAASNGNASQGSLLPL